MEISAGQSKVLEMLIRHEELLSQLYGMYAMKLPHRHKFWYGLALDEKSHAEWLRTLMFVDLGGGGSCFNDARFDPGVIQQSIDLARARLNEVESKTLYPFIAVSTALEMEQAMIERSYFEVCEGDGDEFKRIMATLAEQTRVHVDKLLQEQATLEQEEDE
jgi:rubrerythrin